MYTKSVSLKGIRVLKHRGIVLSMNSKVHCCLAVTEYQTCSPKIEVGGRRKKWVDAGRLQGHKCA